MSFISKPIVGENKTYICPHTEIAYSGMCPITRCPANVSHINKPSGCVHNFLNGKIEVGLQELSYVFGIPTKETKRRIEEGEAAIRLVLLLNTVLIKTRANAKLQHCPRCGVIRTTSGACMRVDQCNERRDIADALLQKAPFNIPELMFTKDDVFRLLNERRRINTFLATLDRDEEESIKFRHILCLKKKEYVKLRSLRSIV